MNTPPYSASDAARIGSEVADGRQERLSAALLGPNAVLPATQTLRRDAATGIPSRTAQPGPGNTTVMSYSVQTLAGAAALTFLAGPYTELYRADAAATAYQNPLWLSAWADTLPPHAQPLCLVVQCSDGTPAAALPLVHDTTTPRPQVYPLSAPASDYVRATGPQADNPVVADAITRSLSQLARGGADVVISDVPAASGLGQALSHTAEHGGGQPHLFKCAVLDLPVDVTTMSVSTRRDHRRRQRRWNDLSSNHLVVYSRSRTTAEMRAAAPVLAQIHHKRWAGRPAQAGAAHPVTADGLDALLSRCGAENAFIATLAVDHAVVAAQLCLHDRRTCYSFVPAMDPAFRDLAPGHALLRNLIRDLHEHGFHALDLGRTTEGQHAYKAQYQPHWTSTLTTVIQPAYASV
ncbi:GNAT family N-acetyltransferase [Streptomyces xanthochromogenes]|uniref:GNAT family N-acetyltransferase n=1 Tax=Streptomyces xanthochromogenes TaxID=67384 RepID=UPI0037B4D9DE